MKEHVKILKLNWNELHVQSREEICFGAAISKRLSGQRWEELELGIQMLLADSLKRRSRGKCRLGGEGRSNPRKSGGWTHFQRCQPPKRRSIY